MPVLATCAGKVNRHVEMGYFHNTSTLNTKAKINTSTQPSNTFSLNRVRGPGCQNRGGWFPESAIPRQAQKFHVAQGGGKFCVFTAKWLGSYLTDTNIQTYKHTVEACSMTHHATLASWHSLGPLSTRRCI